MRTTRILALGAMGLLALTACGTSSGSRAGSGSAYGAGSPSTTAGTSSGGGKATVAVVSSGGTRHLVGPNGHSLYLFTRDQGTTTACTGACASSWPPLVANGTPVAGPGVDGAALSTANGIRPDQVTYHGHLLYYFAGDRAPGDTNGVGIAYWYLVDPNGTAA
jgi:predicted lipoprotein with Yx(FWY)xxD motif